MVIGITGTFEGYVPSPQDLYYKGVNVANITVNSTYGVELQNTKIYLNGDLGFEIHLLTIGKSYDVRSYTQLILEGSIRAQSASTNQLALRSPSGTDIVKINLVNSSRLIFDISQFTSLPSGLSIIAWNMAGGSYIERIRLV